MAATKTTLQIKNTSEPGRVPTTEEIKEAELALNTADQILYSSDGNTVFSISGRSNVDFPPIMARISIGI